MNIREKTLKKMKKERKIEILLHKHKNRKLLKDHNTHATKEEGEKGCV